MLCHDIAVMNQNNDVYNMAQDFSNITKFFTLKKKKNGSVYFSQSTSTEEYKRCTTRNKGFSSLLFQAI